MASYTVQIIFEGEDRASGPARNVQGALGGLGNVAGGLAGGALAGAAGGLLALGAGAAAFVHQGLDFNNSMEIVTAQLNAFTKDGAKSAEILDMIKQRAASTPFAFEDMAEATAALLPVSKQSGLALEDLISKAEILAASNPAEGLEGAAFALKEAAGGDFTSIIERFNLPRQYLNQLKEQGVPAAEAVSMAMQQMGLDTDLVSNLAGTASGRWSTLMDTVTGLAASLTQPMFQLFSDGLGALQPQIDAAMPMLTAMAAELGGNLASGIQVVIQWGGELAGQWGQLVAAAQPVLAELQANLPSALAVAGGAFQQVQALIAAVMPAVLALVMAVLGQLAAFWKANGAEIMAFVRTTFATIGEIVKTALALIQAIIVPALTFLAGIWKNHGTEIQAYLRGVFEVIRGIVSGALSLVQGILKAALALIKGDWQGAWDAMKEGVSGALDGVQSAVKGALEALKGTLGGLVETLKTKAGEIGSGIIDGIKNGIANGIEAIKNAAREAAQAALDAAKRALGIESPSKVFRAEVGAHLASGMALGITDGIPVVERGVGALASSAVAAGQTAPAAASAPAGGSHITISLTGEFARYLDARIDSRLAVHASRAGARRTLGA